MTIDADPRLLQPRSWTVVQATWAEQLLATAPPGAVLDLCCGAGQIGLLVAHRTGRRLVAVDHDPVAVAQTRENAVRAGLAERIEVRCCGVESALDASESFAAIIADPPWVTHAEVTRFPEDPPGAIDGGSDGLGIARRCVEAMAQHLRPGGHGLLQLGSRSQAWALDIPKALTRKEIRTYDRGCLMRLDRR
ncbi:methyltransferase [Luteipulveratus halotolerans]|uniref:methyltransferase n=1 Tax=Luteipulveratus halotolerans TaxID=1631356 RepID=UPI001E3A5264|nr:class I SAM-dependent methyltransferase [Luteipulveratus halotolerans]